MKESDGLREKYMLILFISGMSYKSIKAVENLRKICDTYIKDNFELTIVDVSTDPKQAVEHQLIGIPTLIKSKPGTPRIILGDLSDTKKVLKILDIE